MKYIFLSGLMMAFGFGCAAVQLVPAPEGTPQQFRVSGFSCENGYGADLNQVYVYQGATADGRPYYRGKTRTNRYIYHDARCADDTPNPRWLLGGQPDITRTSDLNPNDGEGCENEVGFDSDAAMPEMGTHTSSWQWCGDHGMPGRTLTLSAD